MLFLSRLSPKLTWETGHFLLECVRFNQVLNRHLADQRLLDNSIVLHFAGKRHKGKCPQSWRLKRKTRERWSCCPLEPFLGGLLALDSTFHFTLSHERQDETCSGSIPLPLVPKLAR